MKMADCECIAFLWYCASDVNVNIEKRSQSSDKISPDTIYNKTQSQYDCQCKLSFSYMKGFIKVTYKWRC